MKNLTITTLTGLATVAASTLLAASAQAANLSYTGTLNTANDLTSFLFTADGTSTVTIRSYGFDGGTNADGTSIVAGGFDPNLTIFDASDNWYADSDDDAISGSLDFNYSAILPAGNYRAVLAVFGNNNTSGAGSSFLPSAFSGMGDFGAGTNAYAVDILNVNNTATAVPEPSSFIGTALAGFGVVLVRRKLSARQHKAK
jgi:hypothetical protein